MTIREEYISNHLKSQELYQQEKEVTPGGVNHDARYVEPFPIFMERGKGSKVWDVDGNEYINFYPGHGTYILGYGHPAIADAIIDQLDRGIEFGSNHELEIKVAKLLLEIFPYAEQVRFIGSGAEANMLAIRLARAYTGKDKFIRFGGHWHGGFDEGFLAVSRPFDVPYSAGVPKDAFRNVLVAKHNDIEDVKRLIGSNDDIACVIMEPTGARHGQLPGNPSFVREVRRITQEKGIVLIFDEVMDNFKLAPGGGQEVLGICPDLSTLGKALGFGLPLSAVIGKKEIMQRLAFTGDKEYDLYNRVRSQGTHSGIPIALAAAYAGLKLLKTGELQAQMKRMNGMFREGLNRLIKRHGISGCAYGDYILRIFLGHSCPYLSRCSAEHCSNPDYEFLDSGMETSVRSNLALALFNNGVKISPKRVELFVNAVIIEQDVNEGLEAFDRSLTELQNEGCL